MPPKWASFLEFELQDLVSALNSITGLNFGFQILENFTISSKLNVYNVESPNIYNCLCYF